MRTTYLLLAASAAAAASPSLAQGGELSLSLGAAYKAQDLEVDGAILGSLAPSTPFGESPKNDRAVMTASAAYDRYLSPHFFLGAEARVEIGEIERTVFASVSASASQIVERCFPPPPGVFPPFCVPFGTFTRTFIEEQNLALDVRTGPSGALVARAGFRMGATRLWVDGGLAAQRAQIAYVLAPVNTVAPPVPPFVLVGVPPLPSEQSSLPPTVVLPGERQAATARLTGWTAGIGLEHRVADRVSLSIRYAYADYGEHVFAGTARLAPVRIAAKAQTFSLAFAFAF